MTEPIDAHGEAHTCGACSSNRESEALCENEAQGYAMEAVWQFLPDLPIRDDGRVLLTPAEVEKMLRRMGWAPPCENRERRKPLYAVHPGHVISRSDGQLHYISAQQLVRLYGLNINDCLIIEPQLGDRTRAMLMARAEGESMTHVYPRYDGVYELPA